jgi:hypothetical protein
VVVPVEYAIAVPVSIAERLSEVQATVGAACSGPRCRSGAKRIALAVGFSATAAAVLGAPEILVALTVRLGATKMAKLLLTPEGRAQLVEFAREFAAKSQVVITRIGVEVAKQVGNKKSEKLASCFYSAKAALGSGVAGWFVAVGRCVDAYLSRG